MKYNVYYNNSKINTEPLSVSNFTYSGADGTGSYTVKAVVKGVEQSASAASTTWEVNSGAGYLDIALANVTDRNGADVTAHYSPNDATMADLDGDGQLEIIIKRINTVDAANTYPYDSKEFTILDAYKVNWNTGAATRMWWIDCGPNMVSMNSTEINIFAYDWDEDGKAEIILRGADDMIVHYSNSSSRTIGVAGANYRNDFSHASGGQYAWTHTGPEYLVYLNGETGELYQQMEFPLLRFEADEAGMTEQQVWSPTNTNGGYGHRSSKYFFGAPFLDGRKASLFLGRGIYTQTKMWTGDLNRSTHQWSQRWTWREKNVSSPWFGQGNHNFTVADVDLDGRDEIVYGSMVIDDNGQGLSTTGFGHGDALHVSKFNPYRKGGLEAFACNEDNPSNNYRDATTSEVFFREGVHYDNDGKAIDDGRCLMANFSNSIPGSIGRSVESGMISSVTNALLPDIDANSYIPWNDLNFRIYWDGDLCDEILNSPGTEREAKIDKPGYGRLFTSSGCNMNNDSKNNPCFQGDVIGDWREEILVRCGTNLRLYTTVTPTKYGIYSLWYDHQYRQAMVWQMCAYNQPPHKSFFLGEMEGFTVAPPPLTNRDRVEINNGDAIGTDKDGKHVMYVAKSTSDAIKYSGKIAPSVLTINVPVVVSGHGDNNNITSTPYRCSLLNADGSSGIQGDARLVKQGEGLLIMSKKTLGYTGDTDVWGGSVQFNGTLTSSMVNMHPHTELYTSGTFSKGITMEYGSKLYLSDKNYASTDVQKVTIGDLTLKEGACVEFDFSATEENCDMINVTNLTVVKKDWENGPQYDAPVFKFKNATGLADGHYKIGTLTGKVKGDLEDVVLEGAIASNQSSPVFLEVSDGTLFLTVGESANADVDAVETWKLDFESPSDNNYGFTMAAGDVANKQQDTRTDGSHCFHIYQGNTNDRTINLTIPAVQSDYRLDFDMAIISGNGNPSNITISGANGSIFTVAFSANGTTATVKDANNTELGVVSIEKYANPGTLSFDKKPTLFYHYQLRANSSGMYLTVVGSNDVVIDEVKISDSFQSVNKISSALGRYHTHVAFDDITLTQYSPIISDKKYMPEAGTYASITMERNLVAGYNTLCLPFDAELATVAGSDEAKAYTLEGGSVENDGSTTTLVLAEVGGTLEANKPYVVWCPRSFSIPNIATATAINPVAGSVTGAGGWTMVGNYTPHLSTKDNYVIYRNELRLCGSTAYIDGMRAYFVAPAGVNPSKIRCVFGSEEATSIEIVSAQHETKAVYGVDGTRRSSLQHGINIIQSADGKTKKVSVK